MKRTNRSVPATETGAIKGDGSGRRTMSPSQGGGRNPNIGIHGRGSPTGNAGMIRGGQSVSARPITASRPAMRPRPPVLTDAADTSRDAQKLVRRPPEPFDNPYGAKNVPAPSNRNYSQKAGLPGKGIYGTSRGGSEISNVGVGNTSLSAAEMAAIGYGPNDTKGTWSIISGQPTRGNQRQAGMPGKTNRGTSAKENARVRQTGY